MKLKNKITILTISFLFFFTQTWGQSKEKRVLLAKKVMQISDVNNKISALLEKENANICKQVTNFFNKNNIHSNKDVSYIKENVNTQLNFIKNVVLERIEFQYQNTNYKKLKKRLKLIDKTPALKSGLIKEVDSLINQIIENELSTLHKSTIPGYLSFVLKKRKPIPLIIKINDSVVKAKDIDIEINILTKNNEKKNILLKEKSLLQKPIGYTYKDIKSLLIIYQNKKFLFTPDKNIFRLPKHLISVKNFLSKYSFEEISPWTISIIDTNTSIIISLSNVVEAVVKQQK